MLRFNNNKKFFNISKLLIILLISNQYSDNLNLFNILFGNNFAFSVQISHCVCPPSSERTQFLNSNLKQITVISLQPMLSQYRAIPIMIFQNFIPTMKLNNPNIYSDMNEYISLVCLYVP